MKLFQPIAAFLCLVASMSLADEYKPLFSKELLEKASPDARARMEALDEENRRRWQTNNPQSAPNPSETNTPAKKIIYRYVDANGKVQFTEEPIGTAIEIESVRPSEVSLLEHAENQKKQQEILADFEERRKIKDRQESEVADREADRLHNKQRCRTLFLNIQDYRRGGVAYYELDKDGNRRYLDHSEVLEEIVSLEQIYQSRCGELPETQTQ